MSRYFSHNATVIAAHPRLPVMIVVTMDQADDLLRNMIEVEDRGVCVEAGGMKLVTILHG